MGSPPQGRRHLSQRQALFGGRRHLDPQPWASTDNYFNPYAAGVVDFAGVRQRGRLAVEIPLLLPVPDLPSFLTDFATGIIQDAASSKDVSTHPIGTGPFRFVSFIPGQQSVFSAYRDYWDAPFHTWTVSSSIPASPTR